MIRNFVRTAVNSNFRLVLPCNFTIYIAEMLFVWLFLYFCLPVRHWKKHTEGIACWMCLPTAYVEYKLLPKVYLILIFPYQTLVTGHKTFCRLKHFLKWHIRLPITSWCNIAKHSTECIIIMNKSYKHTIPVATHNNTA